MNDPQTKLALPFARGSRPIVPHRVLRVLDLFSGLEGWSSPWRERGHEVFRVEIDASFPAEHRDVMTLEPRLLPWRPDVVLASPPCTAFSVMQIGRNWHHDHTPKNDRARAGLALLVKTVELIDEIDPHAFVVENPVGKMRRMRDVWKRIDLERRTVTYCQYGERRRKPTDLWGGVPARVGASPAVQERGGVSRSIPERVAQRNAGDEQRGQREDTAAPVAGRLRSGGEDVLVA